MVKWEQLIACRKHKHLSQAEAAERINVGLVTYQRWELGRRKPQPHHMRRLYEIFDMPHDIEERKDAQDREIALSLLAPVSETALAHITGPSEETNELQTILATNMTSSLWSLALMDHPTYNEKRRSIRQAIKEFDSMNTDNKNYQMTRREALSSLATLPIVTLSLAPPGKDLSSAHHRSVLAQCSASLEACWELYKRGDGRDILLGFRCVSKYLATLLTISKTSAPLQKEALHLATQYALLKTILGWNCAGSTATVQYARDAVLLSKETDNISLQLSACSKLAWAYYYEKKYALALTSAREAEALLQQYTRSSNGEPVYPCVQGGIYSTLALMQVKNGQAPDSALGKATELDPGEEVHAYMDFTRSTLFLEAGWIYYHQGNQIKAMEVLEKRVDPDTFSPRIWQREMGRVEIITIMALSSLKTRDRDLEKTVHFWKAAIEGAKALRSEFNFDLALTAYEHMAVVWPNEPRITSLRDHLVHWEE